MHSWFTVSKDGEQKRYEPHVYTIAEIDIPNLDKIILQEEEEDIPTLIIHFDDPRKRPIYVRRIEMPTGARPYKVVCHIIGWQMNIGGENIQSIQYVFETVGRLEVEIDPDDDTKRITVNRDYHWIESAGKFDRERNSWFASPGERQINMIGSKVDG